MPIMNGDLATQHIREWQEVNRIPRQNVRIVLLTANARASIEGRDIGCDSCVSKPVPIDILRTIIN